MRQVARILVCHRPSARLQVRIQLNGSQKLRHVFHQRREPPGFLGIGRIVLQKLPVFLQRRSATSGIGDDGVVISIQQRVDISPRQARASSRSPACTCSAPQQPCAAGIDTSQPFLRNTRTVASFNRAKLMFAMHPARNATRYRCGVFGRQHAAVVAKEERRLDFGRQAFHLAQPAAARSPASAPISSIRSPDKDKAAAPDQRQD